VATELVSPETPLEAQLRPVRSGLMRGAEERAAQILAEADRKVADVLGDARRRGDALLESARAEGVAAARRSASRVVAETRRESRARVLRAQRDVYERVRALAHERLIGLAGTPAVTELNARLAVVARRRLGTEATVEVSPSGLGIVATCASRRLDLSSDALVELELAGLASRIEELWS
jgi:vacuolar-type H+-ATPase subunit E/Vma4